MTGPQKLCQLQCFKLQKKNGNELDVGHTNHDIWLKNSRYIDIVLCYFFFFRNLLIVC